ncbi:GNAT family N-acetyltransferase [Demequina aestuarii]|uniref:GNAT family N-acetyltransferase n=1 Tax=Demequina aestuarii TaxID=327095 RepID=UPI000783D7DD|nr:GNAT family N-acetyltransferase [Demequina aestuarii]
MTDSLLRRAQHSLAPAQRRDLEEIRAMCAEDPVANVVPMAHVESALSSGTLPAGLWTVRRRAGWGKEMTGAVWAGANVCAVLPEADPESAEERMAGLAAALVARVSRPAALVGPAATTLDLWGRVEPWWGPAREVRPRQVSMRIDGQVRHVPPLAALSLGLDAVRPAREDDYDALLPACVHMFIGEVGYDPMRHGRAAYEDRLHRLVKAGRAYVQFGFAEGRRQIVFKAEVGALAGGVAQLQGVWVHPHLRGRGLARAGLAAVVEAVHADLAPTVSLYVNDFNTAALATYDAVGFVRVGSFATVMF